MDIKVAFIGLGGRGTGLLKDVVLPMKRVSVTSVCDSYEDRATAAADAVEEATGIRPFVTTDYKEAIDNENVNTVVIAAAWEGHTDIALYSMEKGKIVACEVGGVYSIEQCWQLVHTYERTRTPFMFLENCCFGRREMMAMNMVRKGLFGRVIHAVGGYHHDLRVEVSGGKENRHYRLKNYIGRNCENYPTHELGPIAQILNINHGNRMVSLTSTASGSVGLHDYIARNKADNEELMNMQFNQGDIVTTVIKCANGETITLTLDTTLPRYYSRGFTIRGTRGMYEEATDSVFIDREEDIKREFEWRKEAIGNAEEYIDEYEHPVWKEYIEEGVQGTHDGMDYLTFKTFFDAIDANAPMPIDIYDAVSWMCISVLSEQSIACGSAPVYIPDFTNGKWVGNASF